MGCLTPKKSEKEIDKIHQKFPEILAKKSSYYFPCGWKIINMNNQEEARINKIFDSLNKEIIIEVDTIQKLIYCTDTITDISKIEKLKNQLFNTTNFIKSLQKSLNSKSFIVYKNVEVTDSAQLFDLKNETIVSKNGLEKYRNRYENLLKISIWLIIALAISLLLNINRYKLS